MFQLIIKVDVPEWLSGMTRNHVGFARAGSNPAVHAFEKLFLFKRKYHYFVIIFLMIVYLLHLGKLKMLQNSSGYK